MGRVGGGEKGGMGKEGWEGRNGKDEIGRE